MVALYQHPGICNRLTKAFTFILGSFLVLIPVEAQNPASLDSGTAHILSVVAGSKRVQRILKEVKSGTKYRIGFVASSFGDAKLFQGFTSVEEGVDKNGITVHVAPDLSVQLTELLVAHELFHIVLQKQGWPTQVNYSFSRPEMDTTFKGAMLKDAGTALMSCYPDALIDKWMSARGFAPKILNRRQFEHTIQDAQSANLPPSDLFQLYRTYTALINYCLSIRVRDFEMADIFKAYQGINPKMRDDQASLERQLGTEMGCSDAPSCLEATKKLRYAAGFQGQIYFLNRFTNGWQ
jgi:hypothetical protein